MKLTRLFFFTAALAVCGQVAAQDEIVRKINEYGKFDTWCQREVKESGLIG